MGVHVHYVFLLRVKGKYYFNQSVALDSRLIIIMHNFFLSYYEEHDKNGGKSFAFKDVGFSTLKLPAYTNNGTSTDQDDKVRYSIYIII